MSGTHHDEQTGITGDVSRLRTNGAATAAEIREFVAGLKGKSPREMLGAVAESSLFQSLVVATVGCVVLVFVLTAIPYALSSPEQGETATAKVAPARAEDDRPTSPAAADPATTPATAASPGTVDPERAVKALGIGETKEAPSNSNPLESNLDNLLDKLD